METSLLFSLASYQCTSNLHCSTSRIEVLDFADEVSKWPIERIIPAHLKNNLKYTGKDYRAAFSFLEAKGVPSGLPKPLDIDMKSAVVESVITQ